jgi:hypothetical protein
LIIDKYTLNELIINIKQKIEIFKGNQFEHALKNLQNYFSSEADKKNKTQYVKLEGGKYILNVDLSDNAFLNHVIDILKYGIERYNIEFGEFYGDFKLYSNYTTEQFMMTLCENSLIYFRGTKINETTVYILVNLKKDDKKEERLKYKDKFLDKKTFQWESQTGTTLYNKHGMDNAGGGVMKSGSPLLLSSFLYHTRYIYTACAGLGQTSCDSGAVAYSEHVGEPGFQLI